MATYRPVKRDGLSFGDVCRADFLHDVFVREDAHLLSRETTTAEFARKRGWGDTPISYFIPLEASSDGLVLAHGSRVPLAICLSDDCAIESVFGRGERPTGGRLLFAPLDVATADDIKALRAAPSYGRFELAADETVSESHIAALRRCFMVDARALEPLLGTLVAYSTTDDTRDALASQWAGYACRRGPLVVEDNLEKFAELMLAHGLEEADAIRLGNSLAAVAGAAWGYEGGGLESAGQTADSSGDPRPVLDDLTVRLDQLHALIEPALKAVAQARAGVS